MNIYILRHADATPVGEGGVTSDEDRPLSAKGIEQVGLVADGLKHMDITIDKIVSSSLLRAVQTAEELRHKLESTVEITTCIPLAPGGSTKKLLKCLRKLGGEHVLLVGHEPDLGEHTAALIGSRKTKVEYAKAGLACISCNDSPRKGTGTLLWLVTPAWLGMSDLPTMKNEERRMKNEE